jgi:hypothetical protein
VEGWMDLHPLPPSSSPAEPRALVRVCFLVAGRSHIDKAAMQAHSLEKDKLTKAREVKLKAHQDS